jgi:two-component system, NarL family, response regulator DegU
MATRLLIADDHRMLRQSLRRSLEHEGYDIVGEACDGVEAVAMAAALQPDVVLMDVTMPNLDGVAATQKITALMSDIKVVVLTMHADTDVARRALAAGASGYLVKDCSIDDVHLAIQRAILGQIAVAEAIAARLNGPPTEPLISARETELLQLFADGCSSVEVAEQLFISAKTVKNHLASIYDKLDARDRTEAVVKGVRAGLVHVR